MKKIKYVECLQAVNDMFYIVGKSYKIIDKSLLPSQLNIMAENGIKSKVINWTEEFLSAGNNCFKIIEEKCKDEVLSKGLHHDILTVKSSEGAIFEVGDKITVFTKTSPNKGKQFTIEGFRWNNNKTSICVLTESHGKNGIGLDKIELYTELSLLDLAKIKYPVGCKVNNFDIIGVRSIGYPGDFNCGSEFEEENNFIVNVSLQGYSRTIYSKILGKWAKRVN